MLFYLQRYLFIPMAKLVLKFLTIVILFQAGNGDDMLRPFKNITLGSKLYPQYNPPYWLSPSGIFAFGFYKKGDGFAVGIWLQTERIVTWTANRDDPPIPSNAYLELTEEGKLLVRTTDTASGFIPIVYNLQAPATSASLLDSGNFVLFDGDNNVIWKSFDYPTDTILGGQKLLSGESLISSVSVADRSSGRFKLVLQHDGKLAAYPVSGTGAPDEAYWSYGAGFEFDGLSLVLTETGRLYLDPTFDLSNDSIAQGLNVSESSETMIYRATLDADGNFRLYAHKLSNSRSMMTLWSALTQFDPCKVKGFCGLNSYCSSNASKGNATCSCFPGFIYHDPDPDKKFLGCYRNFSYERICGIREDNSLSNKYYLIPIENMEIGGDPYVSIPMVQGDCCKSCISDCNCWAVLHASGNCSKYKPPLLYATQDQNHSGVAFIKQSHNSFQSAEPKVLSYSMYRRRAVKYQKLLKMENFGLNKEFTLRSFSYNELEKATNGFKEEIGCTSYGKIYGGIISQGDRIVAVKRLEKVDDEGEREFIAEMAAMGRIHHKNVVQLVGFCLEGAKKLLVYDFMKTRSLAECLSDVEKRPFWNQRMKLAFDIAQGILYLHQECDTHIIHCNIRPENILVGDNWTAKIANFSSAKLLIPYQKQTLALERQGRGYSAPEWQKKASASEKVDVYSYGVVLLEIICCNSTEEINVQSVDNNFSTRVYDYFMAKQLRKLTGDEEVDKDSLERMVKVGLCCIHHDPDLRPSMKNVILMLEGTIDTPAPLCPI
ncbi:G-type lectin S-receptor-like serine/threonine-protein kinase LECRK1 isoform X2 [Coffea eugenioides]|uniref:G-type lectin S-receptor-like serine/threonine-protein kinase LECRK1 isoform X2 n=1 Tax=Coffea eugenioides TaxID=49369 RepID=UPI000F6116FF|nr:G-type lectin S-receptor-like serine/threonine-protein kinase LECRK1 isoform X2 [Coffea eugenioides]